MKFCLLNFAVRKTALQCNKKKPSLLGFFLLFQQFNFTVRRNKAKVFNSGLRMKCDRRTYKRLEAQAGCLLMVILDFIFDKFAVYGIDCIVVFKGVMYEFYRIYVVTTFNFLGNLYETSFVPFDFRMG